MTKQIAFELGAIAYHCQEVYLSNPGRYDDYVPLGMLGASNDFYNYILDSYYVFKSEDSTTLKAAWAMYRTYCEEANVPYPLSQRLFKEELKNRDAQAVLQNVLKQFDLRFTLVLPTGVDATNATQVSDDKRILTWKLPLGEETPMEATVTYLNPVKAAGSLMVLLVVGGVGNAYYRKRKRMEKAGA